MKTLKLNKEDVLVCGKWRRLIRCTITIVMILALLEGGGNVSNCLWYRLTRVILD